MNGVRIVIGLLAVCGAWSWDRLEAAEPPPPAAWQAAVSQIVLDLIPHTYVDEKKWGGTKEFTTGLKITRDGLRVSTKRRRKELNHGTWKRYEARLLDPEQAFQFRILDTRRLPDEGLEFVTRCDARLFLHGRLSQWERGVQLFSLSAEADAEVVLSVTCQLDGDLDVSRFPPALVLEPRATDARLELRDFHLRSISDLDGPLVRQLGKGLQDILEEKLEEKRPKLVEKINRQIDKHREDLTIRPF